MINLKLFLFLFDFLGISRSAKGYGMISVLETMKTYSIEDGLTEEALVTKLRTCQCHHLFLHSSLKHNSSGLEGHAFLFLMPCNLSFFGVIVQSIDVQKTYVLR